MTDTPKVQLAGSASQRPPKSQTEDLKTGSRPQTEKTRATDKDLGSGVYTSAIEPGKSGGATAI